MSGDLDKAVELLMTMLGNKEESEDYNELSSEDEIIEPESENTDEDLSDVFESFSGGNDKRVTLLSSIKPYMNGKRQEKVDMAINMVRILSVSSTLGLGKLFDIR